MSKSSRNSNSSSSSSSSSAGNAKLPKVVAAIPRAFVSLTDSAANSASFRTSSANVSMVRPAPNSASFQTSSTNVSMVRPAPNVTSVKPSSSNVSMVRPAQSSLALSSVVNSGQQSKSAETRTDKTVLIYQSLSRYPLMVRVQFCHLQARRYQKCTPI